MSIKESSDEVNPPVAVAGAAVPKPRSPRSAKDLLAVAIATCGVGYLPLAPGTWGSLVGIGCYVLLQFIVFKLLPLQPLNEWRLHPSVSQVAFLMFLLPVVVTAISIVGVWAATRVEKLSQRKDPGIVVIDEVAGQLLTFLFVLEYLAAKWIIVGFFLFRFFDIVKPPPARRFEKMRGGLGVVGDDLVAGVYAAWILAAAMTVSRLAWR